jgi:hypothetical protein
LPLFSGTLWLQAGPEKALALSDKKDDNFGDSEKRYFVGMFFAAAAGRQIMWG